MANGHGDDLRALKRVIGLCRARAAALDMPALSHILSRAEASMEPHQASPPRAQRALSVPRGRVVRH